jgi:hypothetical protein
MSRTLDGAILSTGSIYLGREAFNISKQLSNGVIIGTRNGTHIAIHRSILKQPQTLRPVVGRFQTNWGWIWPNQAEALTYEEWLRRLRCRSPLEWDAILQAHIKPVDWVKFAVEDWSPDDLALLKKIGWFVGFSAAAPLWRIYARAPREVWDSTDEDLEMLVLDGQIRSLQRFGAILDLEKHRLQWR